MSVQSILNNVSSVNVNTISKATEKKSEETNIATTKKTTGFDETAVVYEKSKRMPSIILLFPLKVTASLPQSIFSVVFIENLNEKEEMLIFDLRSLVKLLLMA